jgi:hypothetical protein
VAPADDGAALSSEVVVGGEKAGVVLGAGSDEVKRDFAGVAADASGDVDDFSLKTLDPVPPPNVASPPVFHAGTDSAAVGAAWPNADGPLEANAPNPPPPLIVGVATFVSAGFKPLKVAGPPDANVLNAPPLPKDGEVVLTGVTMSVVDPFSRPQADRPTDQTQIDRKRAYHIQSGQRPVRVSVPRQ